MTSEFGSAAMLALALQAVLGGAVGILFMLWLRLSVERAANSAGAPLGPARLLLGAALRVAVAVAAIWAIGLGAPSGALAAALGFGLGRWVAARRFTVGAAR